MCLLVLITGILGPRVAVVLTWLLTDRVQIAFNDNWVVPGLGVIFLPWTTLAYVFCYAPATGVSPLGWFVVILGVVLDGLTYSSRAISNRYQMR